LKLHFENSGCIPVTISKYGIILMNGKSQHDRESEKGIILRNENSVTTALITNQ
jgi:hypothetical protein